MAQVSTIPGFGANFLANLPAVPQKSVTCHGTVNLLETLNAIVVPPKQAFPGTKGHTEG